MNAWFEKQFKLSEHGTDVRTEILAGITTFMTMAYIIFVNPGILSTTGMPFGSLLVATCLGASLATFLMAFLANYPFALAPGMGLNAFFAFTVVLGMKIPWQVALAAIFIEGVIFILLTCTKVREEVVNSIPKTLKIGVSAGIGIFITFIGLQSAGLVVANPAVLVGLSPLRSNAGGLLALAGLLLMVTLETRRVTGGILIGIVAVTLAGIPLGITKMPAGIVSMPPSLSPIFMKMDFSMIAQPTFWVIVLTFFFVDFFDTVGTLVGVDRPAAEGDFVVLDLKAEIDGEEVDSVSGVSYPLAEHQSITGWCTDKEALTNPVDSVTLENSNIDLYAKVETGYWITFESNGGSYVEPMFSLRAQRRSRPQLPSGTATPLPGGIPTKR